MLQKKKPIKLAVREALTGYAFFLPWIIGFLLFTLYPLIYSVLLSVNNVELKPGNIILTWAGGDFYNYALNVDTKFSIHLGETIMFICCATPVVMVFSIIIALMLNQKIMFRAFFRSTFFMPAIIMSGPVISKLLIENTVDFAKDGSQIILFISSLPESISTICMFILNNLVLILWFSGVQILIFLAGLQKISPSLYEAADIDGAGAWEKLWKITLPHIAPIATICAVYTVIEIANYSGNSVNTDISEQLFNTSMLYSLSSAMSWIYFIVVMLILLVVYFLFWLAGRRGKQ